MRERDRISRLVLDAIEAGEEHGDPPTLTGIVDYIRQRRRVWVWTHAAILIAVLSLEGEGRIEAQRSRGARGEVRWIYTGRTREGFPRPACGPCSWEGRRPGEGPGEGGGSRT